MTTTIWKKSGDRFCVRYPWAPRVVLAGENTSTAYRLALIHSSARISTGRINFVRRVVHEQSSRSREYDIKPSDENNCIIVND